MTFQLKVIKCGLGLKTTADWFIVTAQLVSGEFCFH